MSIVSIHNNLPGSLLNKPLRTLRVKGLYPFNYSIGTALPIHILAPLHPLYDTEQLASMSSDKRSERMLEELLKVPGNSKSSPVQPSVAHDSNVHWFSQLKLWLQLRTPSYLPFDNPQPLLRVAQSADPQTIVQTATPPPPAGLLSILESHYAYRALPSIGNWVHTSLECTSLSLYSI